MPLSKELTEAGEKLLKHLADNPEIGIDVPNSLNKVHSWIKEQLKSADIDDDRISEIMDSVTRIGEGMIFKYTPQNTDLYKCPFMGFADIDALPKPPQMANDIHDKQDMTKGWHGCGHNGHSTALAMAFVHYVIEAEKQGKHAAPFHAVFYGGEEDGTNPSRMIEEGLLNEIPLNARLLFIHNSPRQPKIHEWPLFWVNRGTLTIAKEGCTMSARDELTVSFQTNDSDPSGFKRLFAVGDFLEECRTTITKNEAHLFADKPADTFLPEDRVKIQPTAFKPSTEIEQSNINTSTSFTIDLNDKDCLSADAVETILNDCAQTVKDSGQFSDAIEISIEPSQNKQSLTVSFNNRTAGHSALSAAPQTNALFAMASFTQELKTNEDLKSAIDNEEVTLQIINGEDVEKDKPYSVSFDMRSYDPEKAHRVTRLFKALADKNAARSNTTTKHTVRSIIPATVNNKKGVSRFKDSLNVFNGLACNFLKPISASDTFGAIGQALRERGRNDALAVYAYMPFASNGPNLHEVGYKYPASLLPKQADALLKAAKSMSEPSSIELSAYKASHHKHINNP